MKIHPLTCEPPKDVWPTVMGGSTGVKGMYGYTRDRGMKLHRGTDFSCLPGRAVFAAHDGRVARAGEQEGGRGFGQRIYLQGDDIVTVYAHLSAQLVSVGDFVRAGAALGLLGRSGNVEPDSETHLHFECRQTMDKLTSFNPEWWLHGDKHDKQGQPRLEV